MPSATVLSVFVLSGKDQDVAVREHEERTDTSLPPQWALFAGHPESRKGTLVKILELHSTAEQVADGAEATCRALADEKIAVSLGEDWRAGPLYIRGRDVDENGYWIPNGPGVAGEDRFAYGFVLQSRNDARGDFQDYVHDLPVREETYLVARALVVVKSTTPGDDR